MVLRRVGLLIDMVRRLRQANYLAKIGLLILSGIIFLAVFAPLVAPYDPNTIDIANKLSPPSLAHPMGTDFLGRDIFSRVVYGSQTSIQVGLIAVGVATAMGVPLGLISGFYGGNVDNAIMRLMDVLFAFPAIILAIAMITILGQSTVNVMLAIGIVYTPIFARVSRSGVLSIREMEFVTAAKVLGDTNLNIIRRDILPNVVAPIIVQMSVSFAFAIIVESSLSFLGLGSPPPDPSWGRMLSQARPHMESAPWYAFFPGFSIMLAVLAFNFVGDGLRDVLDPRQDVMRGGGL